MVFLAEAPTCCGFVVKVVTLLTDFGLKDGYVAQMKGVVLHKCPDSLIIDISHEIERHNILMGSFVLETTVPYFPRDTIHVAVVDPGVGSNRKAIVVECEFGFLVGPDNGLMARASERLCVKSIRQIREKSVTRKSISNTFHGRDIFARVAAVLASGKKPEEIGPRINELEKLNLSAARLVDRRLKCQVLHVDNFGNIITNVEEDLVKKIPRELGGRIVIKSGKREFQAEYVSSYHELGPRSIGALIGSQGYLEIAIREKSAAKKLDLKPLDRLEIRL